MSWNNAFDYILNIKKEYIDTFGKLDTYNLKTMCEKLNKLDFLNNVIITNDNEFNLIKYNMIECRDLYTNPNSIYRELRSLVIDLKNDKIVIAPFKKFFNINEIEETSINVVNAQIENAKSIEITDKMDGSMQCMRFYNGHVFATGSQAINKNMSYRLQETYSWLEKLPNYINMFSENPHLTFIFEYISLQDIHTVIYSKEQQGLYLIGIRNVDNGYQFSYNEVKSFATKYNVKMTTIENKSFDTILSETSKYSCANKEGWVINIDGQFYKLKCDEYVQLAKILSSQLNPKHVMECIKLETIDDLIAKLPTQFKQPVIDIYNNTLLYVSEITKNINSYYISLKDIKDRKSFALQVKSKVPNIYHKYMFKLFDNKNIDVLHNVEYENILHYLNVNNKC